MKQLYYLLTAAALLLAGCQKHASEAAADVEVDKLTVNASVDGVPVAQALQAQTRAANEDVDLTDHGFYLAGYHTNGKMATAVADAYPNVFNKEVTDLQAAVPLVTYVDSKFTLKTIKWLLDDVTYLSFFGWSQSEPIPTTGVTGTTTGIIGQTKDDNDKGYPWIDIRNADAPADQTDVVGSRSLDHKNDVVVSAIDLDFRHLLTKLTFKAKSTSGANVTITAVNIKYATDKVRKKARYTFGSEAAAIGAYSDFAEYHNGTVALNTTYPAVTNGAEAILGSALLLPQTLDAGDISLEITYKISPNGALAGPELTKTLPLPAFAFQQGNNYAYAIDIQATEISVSSSPLIVDWDVVAAPLPLVPGPADGKTLLLLDGYDKPYIHTDGKAYWLDRSGYNNHCEIDGYTDGMYDAANHSYNMTTSHTLIVPPFPLVTALSTDIITENTNRNNTILGFYNRGHTTANSNDRRFYVESNYLSDQTMYFDTDGVSSRAQYKSSATELASKLMWTFQKQDKGVVNLYINAMPKVTRTAVANGAGIGLLEENTIGGSRYAGKISYVKVSSTIVPLGDVANDFVALNTKYNLAKVKGTFLPSVTNGLIGCWDARSGLQNYTGNGHGSVWVDQAGEGLVMTADVPTTTNPVASFKHDATEKAIVSVSPTYSLKGVSMQNTGGFPTPLREITVETVSKTIGPVLSFFMSIRNKANQRILVARPNTGTGNTSAVELGGIYNQQCYVGNLATYNNTKRSLVYILNMNTQKAKIYHNGVLIKEVGFVDNAPTDPFVIDNIILFNQESLNQAFVGNVYAFRMYNRELTETEITTNYNTDKTTFGLP